MQMIRHVVATTLEAALKDDWNLVRARLDALCTAIARTSTFAPPIVAQRFLISGEDHRHSWHIGFDPIAIGRACWRRLARGKREGASTIEQQIVRVITNRRERTLRRKLREIALAILVARHYPKHDLPSVYLWIGYYGWRMNGYRQACRRLGMPPHALSLEEAAMLVARLKYPEPRQTSPERLLQIHRRAKHLHSLYERHLLDGTYRDLDDSPVCDRSTSFKRLPQS
jgi:monofunctional glycosyltransferase